MYNKGDVTYVNVLKEKINKAEMELKAAKRELVLYYLNSLSK